MTRVYIQFLNAALVTIFVFMVIALSGCEVLVASAAGVGAGYFVAKEERPAKQVLSDASITGEIKTKYVQDETVSAFDINVDTYNGNVTLSGSVSSPEEVQKAVGIAHSVKGVKMVTSELTVAPQSS